MLTNLQVIILRGKGANSSISETILSMMHIAVKQLCKFNVPFRENEGYNMHSDKYALKSDVFQE